MAILWWNGNEGLNFDPAGGLLLLFSSHNDDADDGTEMREIKFDPDMQRNIFSILTLDTV